MAAKKRSSAKKTRKPARKAAKARRPAKKPARRAVKPIPDGFHTVTPYVVVRGVAEFMDFLAAAFGAKEMGRMPRADGTVMHAQVRIGDSMVMMGEHQGEGALVPGMLYLYVKDADAAYARALAAGATSIREPTDQLYGDRNAGVRDPFGNQWWMATHKEDVSDEEMRRRFAAGSRS